MHIDILRPLRDVVRRERPENGELTVCFSFTTMLQHTGQGFLSKEQRDNTAGFPDLAPADIYLFPALKSELKGRRFCDASDIFKNARES